jgi:hypothetical protein
MQGEKMAKYVYAVEQDQSLKAFFRYCTAHCSLGTAGAVTACNVTLL